MNMEPIANDLSQTNLAETLAPQEQLKPATQTLKRFSIGIPKEISIDENRIALVPSAVQELVQNGHAVYFERGAGDNAKFSDLEFSEAGAKICETTQEVYQAEIIVKVAPPKNQEIDYLRPRQVLFSSVQSFIQQRNYFTSLMQKKITAFGFEFVKDNSNAFPVMRSMSEIAGAASILIAAEYLSHPMWGKGSMLGGFPGINPSEVVILGGGTVAEYAARTALGMGALVKIFDDKIYKLRNIQYQLSSRVFTSIIQPKVLLKSLQSADVLITALYSREGRTPVIITEEMVSQMKKGSVIIDVSIDQGGCVETSHPTSHSHPVYQVHEVTHYCVPNIASKVPHTASYAISNVFSPLILKIGYAGGIEKYLFRDLGLRQGVYIFNGLLTNKTIGEYFTLPFKNIELLMAAFH